MINYRLPKIILKMTVFRDPSPDNNVSILSRHDCITNGSFGGTKYSSPPWSVFVLALTISLTHTSLRRLVDIGHNSLIYGRHTTAAVEAMRQPRTFIQDFLSTIRTQFDSNKAWDYLSPLWWRNLTLFDFKKKRYMDIGYVLLLCSIVNSQWGNLSHITVFKAVYYKHAFLINDL